MIFGDFNLTRDERRIQELDRKIYDLAVKQKNKTKDITAYKMPTPYEDDEGQIDKNKKYKVLLTFFPF